MNFGKVTPQTCPESGGVLMQIREGGFTHYRCHTGHAVLVSVTDHIEETLWRTLRTLEEAVMLLENTNQEFGEAGDQVWPTATPIRRARWGGGPASFSRRWSRART